MATLSASSSSSSSVDETLSTWFSLTEQIGIGAEERQSLFASALDEARQVCQNAITKELHVRDELVEQLGAIQADTGVLARRLGSSTAAAADIHTSSSSSSAQATDIENKDDEFSSSSTSTSGTSAPVRALPLRKRVSSAIEHRKQLQQLAAERTHAIQQAQVDLRQLKEQLGNDVEDEEEHDVVCDEQKQDNADDTAATVIEANDSSPNADVTESATGNNEAADVAIQTPASNKSDADLSEERLNALLLEISAKQDEIANRKEQKKEILARIIGLLNELCVGSPDEDETAVPLDERVRAEPGSEAAIGDGEVDEALMEALRQREMQLMEIRGAREERLRGLALEITTLWQQLQVPNEERKAFLGQHSGLGNSTLDACDTELKRLKDLKRASLGRLVGQARVQLAQLWDQLRVPPRVRDAFLNSWSPSGPDQQYEEEHLDAHEREIVRLRVRLNDWQHMLTLVKRREAILDKRSEFEIKEKDPARFKIPGALLALEKERRLFTKRLPMLNKKIAEAANEWLAQHPGDPFCVDIETPYVEIIEQQQAENQSERKARTNKRHARKKSATGSLEDEQAAEAATAAAASAGAGGAQKKTVRPTSRRVARKRKNNSAASKSRK